MASPHHTTSMHQFRQPETTIPDQIADLKKLQSTPHRQAPSAAHLDWFQDQFNLHWHPSAPKPYLYTTEDGGLLAEWETGIMEYSLEIQPNSRIGEIMLMGKSYDLDDLEAESHRIPLDNPNGWFQLAKYIGVAPK